MVISTTPAQCPQIVSSDTSAGNRVEKHVTEAQQNPSVPRRMSLRKPGISRAGASPDARLAVPACRGDSRPSPRTSRMRSDWPTQAPGILLSHGARGIEALPAWIPDRGALEMKSGMAR